MLPNVHCRLLLLTCMTALRQTAAACLHDMAADNTALRPVPCSCRSNVDKLFHVEEVYDGDISVVQIATCKANSERVIIKSFKRDKLANRMDLQNKVRLNRW